MEALTRQPVIKRETAAAAAKSTATEMAAGNAAQRHHGIWRRPPWSLWLRLWPMMDTYLGRYAALQKVNAVAAVLDFTGENGRR